MTNQYQIPEPPEDLKDRGKDFWVKVVGQYDLRPDELELLSEICAQLDLVEALRHRVDIEGATLGDGRVNPATIELRLARQELRRSMAQLALPAEGEHDAEVRSRRARHAAVARWKNRGTG